MALTGCAAQDETVSPNVETIPVTSPSTSEPPATTVAPTTTSTTNTTSTTTVPLPPATFEPGAGGAEPQGLPPFFVAVRDDSAVVEINTVTGRTTRVLIPPPEPDPPNAEIEGNRIGSVWWHRESGRMVVEEGPEPAGGNIWHMPIGADYAEVRDSSFDSVEGFRFGGGWQAAPSPNGDYVLHTGYFVSILATGVQDQMGIDIAANDGSFSFTPVWLRDRVGIAFTTDPVNGVGPYGLDVVELDARGQVSERRTFEIDRPAAGMAVRADGSLVVLLDDGDPLMWGGSEALVIDPDTGETIAEFALEDGSHSLTYDPTGTYLLYVDGEGTARWQGRGQSGVLAEGLLHADW